MERKTFLACPKCGSSNISLDFDGDKADGYCSECGKNLTAVAESDEDGVTITITTYS